MALFAKLFRKNNHNCASRRDAKERLELVLAQDRVNIDGDKMEALKNDLIDVVDKYLDIDRSAMDVSLKRENHTVAIVANLPMRVSRAANP